MRRLLAWLWRPEPSGFGHPLFERRLPWEMPRPPKPPTLGSCRTPDHSGRAFLEKEATWLETAHRNSANHGQYSEEYRAGFEQAARWVRWHAENGQW